jgi:hypothetical protein
VYGAYDSLDKAMAGLEEYKNIFIDELVESVIDPEYTDEEIQEAKEDLQTAIYGSTKDGYFEIDYSFADTRNEMHISIRDVEVQ